jgi:hypothetical protein
MPDMHQREQNDTSAARKWSGLLFAAAGICAVLALAHDGNGQEGPPPRPAETAALRPVVDAEKPPELALLMGDLQRLTHKMALSANEGNGELAAFYLHESVEQLNAIQEQAPEYEGKPVALLIERLAMPAYEKFKETLTARPPDKEKMLAGLDIVIQSCNQCHAATQHQIIRITRGTEVNPFNQSFKP